MSDRSCDVAGPPSGTICQIPRVVVVVVSGMQLKISDSYILVYRTPWSTASSTETGSGPHPLLQAV